MSSWHERVTDNVLAEAAARLGVHTGELRHMGGFENVIYAFDREKEPCVLRISHTSHRSEEQIASEMHWISFLADEGAAVSRPLLFSSGGLVERLETEDGAFLFSQSARAPGRQVNGKSPEWDGKLFTAWGAAIGRMHVLSRRYAVPACTALRPSLDIPASPPSEEAMPREKSVVWQSYLELSSSIYGLERKETSFGMCHRDLHHGNFCMHEGRLTAFDFDDCGYDHFIQDIAMAVYYSSTFADWLRPETDPGKISDSAKRFLESFIKGYEGEHRLSADNWKDLSLFMDQRRSDLWLILHDAWSRPEAGPAQRDWLESNLRGISEGRPCIEL